MGCPLQEKRFKFSVGPWIDPHTCVPLGVAATLGRDSRSTVTDRVAFELDWMSAAITNAVALLLFERMVAVRDEQ